MDTKAQQSAQKYQMQFHWLAGRIDVPNAERIAK
jgi:hypothetical protein